MKLFPMFCIPAILAMMGCMSSGVHVDQSQVSGFQKGKTTYQEVIGSLGAPTGTTIDSDGRRVINYSYMQSRTKAATFIPIVGMFAGGADVKTSAVWLRFDGKGILQDYSAMENGVGSELGALATGTPSGQVESQPRQAGQ